MLKHLSAIAALAFLVVGAAGPATAETIEFKFKTRQDAQGWSSVAQKWKVKNKAFTPIFNEEGSRATAALDDLVVKDGAVSADIRRIKKNTASGVVLRTVFDGPLMSGYNFLVLGADGGVGVGRLFLLLDVPANGTGGGEAELLCDGSFELANKSLLRLEAKGTKLKAFYNGALVCSAIDKSIKKGQVALQTSTTAAYKSVTIETD